MTFHLSDIVRHVNHKHKYNDDFFSNENEAAYYWAGFIVAVSMADCRTDYQYVLLGKTNTTLCNCAASYHRPNKLVIIPAQDTTLLA